MAVQILRPAWGYGSDVGGRRTPWIIGGMAVLALGGVGAALGTALAATSSILGLALAAIAFLLVGVGAGAAGTSVLAMLASRVAPSRRAAAATTVWVMMIFGFAITAPLAGHFLDPFSNARLVAVTATVSGLAFLLACLAVWGSKLDQTRRRGRRRLTQSHRFVTPSCKSGRSRPRVSSPYSFLFRCSPTAPRNCSSSPSPAWSSA